MSTNRKHRMFLEGRQHLGGLRRSVTALAALVGVLGLGQAGWAATASLGGSAQPVPSNTMPQFGDIYNVSVLLANASFSLDFTCVGGTANGSMCNNPGGPCGTGGTCTSQVGKAIQVYVGSNPFGSDPASFYIKTQLSCQDAFCNSQTPQPVATFVDPGNATGCDVINDPCVTMCSDRQCVGGGTGVNGAGAACRANSDCASNVCGVAQGTTVYYRSNNCLLNPFETQKDLVHVRVQEQPVGLPTFFMTGQAIFTGTSGTCTSAVCTNTTAVTGVYCSGNANCNWSALQGSGSGSSQLFPSYCGNGVVGDSPGETCDPPASLGGGHCSINPRDLCSGPGTCADFVDTVGGTCPGCIDGTQPECTCAQTCELNLNCRDDCTYCGDGIIDNPADAPNPNEQCDNDDNPGNPNCDPANPASSCTCSTACLPCAPVTLGDFIWDDTNRNGVQDPGEPGIPNVQVDIQDCSGNTITTLTTDAGGFYKYTTTTCDPNVTHVNISVDTNQAALTGYDHTVTTGGNDATDSDCGKGSTADQSQCRDLTVASPSTSTRTAASSCRSAATGLWIRARRVIRRRVRRGRRARQTRGRPCAGRWATRRSAPTAGTRSCRIRRERRTRTSSATTTGRTAIRPTRHRTAPAARRACRVRR